MKILQLYHSEERIVLPKEDAWAMDEKRNIFAVADGVHLRKGIEYQKPGVEYKTAKYPNPSPAGKLAQEFCSNFIRFAHANDVKKSFARANRSVFHLNKNRDKHSTFSKAEAYYAATGAFGKIKGSVLEWGYICDSSVSVIDSRGRLVFWRTDHWHHGNLGPILRKYSGLDQSYFLRTIFRNALSPKGEKIGYGVITGEATTEPYVNFGKRVLRSGDVVVFATDGFEEFFKEAVFRRALVSMDKKIVEQVVYSLQKKHKKAPDFFSERTLIAVKKEN